MRRSNKLYARTLNIGAARRCLGPVNRSVGRVGRSGSETAMFSHITIGTQDLPRALAFYDAALAPLGIH